MSGAAWLQLLALLVLLWLVLVWSDMANDPVIGFVDAARQRRPFGVLTLRSALAEGGEACRCDGDPAALIRETIHGTPSYQRSRRSPVTRHRSIVGRDQDGGRQSAAAVCTRS